MIRRVLVHLRPHRVRFSAGLGLTLLGIALDLLKPVDLSGIYDLEPLKAVLQAAGEPAVTGL